jgi:hypothetical protein
MCFNVIHCVLIVNWCVVASLKERKESFGGGNLAFQSTWTEEYFFVPFIVAAPYIICNEDVTILKSPAVIGFVTHRHRSHQWWPKSANLHEWQTWWNQPCSDWVQRWQSAGLWWILETIQSQRVWNLIAVQLFPASTAQLEICNRFARERVMEQQHMFSIHWFQVS